MTDLRKAAEMALEFLEPQVRCAEWCQCLLRQTIDALRAALEQEKKWDLIAQMHNVEDKT